MIQTMVKAVKEVVHVVHRIHQLNQLHQLHIPNPKAANNESASFKDILRQNETLKVSKHAKKRLSERNIQLSDQQLQTMNEKVKEAKQKGITDSLVVYNDAAFVVNTKNDTIVTAMNLKEANSKIFTNINGTILIHD